MLGDKKGLTSEIRGITDMLGRFWKKVKIFLEKVGNFQSRVLLTLFYILLVIPMGLIMKLFSDPLRLRGQGDSAWIPKKYQENDSQNVGRQF